jgi:hypothetical protein
MPGIVRALFILAWALVRALWARVTGRPTGLPLFLRNYREDRLPPVTVDERDEMAAFSGCIACGLCDEGEGGRIAASKGVYPGLMQVVLASSRSMPDYDAARRALEFVPEAVLAEKEGICPNHVPIRRLVRFVRAKADSASGLSATEETSTVSAPS